VEFGCGNDAMHLKRWTRAAAVLALTLAAAAGEAEGERSVRIAVEGAFPPFNYTDQTGELQGFEVDLGKAVCDAMPARCTFVAHQWDGIVKGLLNREYDAVMSSLLITERRKKRVAFSRPYYRIPISFITTKDGPAGDVGPAALAGKTIGVIDGSPEAAYLAAKFATSQAKPYPKLEDAELDLLTGRIELVLGDKLALSRFIEGREGAECCRFAGDVTFDPAYFGEGAAVGLRKDDEELRDAFDRAIGRIMTDGTYDKIRAKYFSFDVKPAP
jgi:polar amino acid transport system substrate-binding protein